MNRFGVLALLVALSTELYSQRPAAAKPSIPELVIGRISSFDSGPTFDSLEVILVLAAPAATEVTRALLTPAADTCVQSAKVEFSEGLLHESIPDLVGGVDLCAFSQERITSELKRRNEGLVVRGANVVLQVQCPGGIRVLPSAILDREIAGAKSDTDQFTSFTMRLLSKLDAVLKPGAMDKPAYPQLAGESAHDQSHAEGEFDGKLKSGEYDGLFPGIPDRASAIYAASQIPAPAATVKLVRSEPFEPDTSPMPVYPPNAKAARLEGDVSFHLVVGSGCLPEDIAIDDGPQMLREAVEKAVKDWNYCQVPEGQEIRATIAFRLNCPAP